MSTPDITYDEIRAAQAWEALGEEFKETPGVPAWAKTAVEIAAHYGIATATMHTRIKVMVADGRLVEGKSWRMDARGHRNLMKVYWPKA